MHNGLKAAIWHHVMLSKKLMCSMNSSDCSQTTLHVWKYHALQISMLAVYQLLLKAANQPQRGYRLQNVY